ncbi:MAG: TolC family protein [Sediminibacterium sp.]|nr:MAG: TolC family protein [Sediminibacterium sp.]
MKKFWFFFIFLVLVNIAKAQEKSLAYFIENGLENNPLLKDYRYQQRSNLIDSLRILAGYQPQVNAVSTSNYAPTIGGWGYDGAITNGTNFSQLMTVSKRLVSKENLQNQQAAIQLLNESLINNGKITEQDLKKSIIAQYITAYGDWLQLGYNKEVLALLKKQQNLLKNLTEKTVYRQTDYLSFLVTMQQQEFLISQLTVQYQNDYSSLNYLCALKDTIAVALQKPSIELALIPEAETSIFYQQYKTDSLRLKNSDALIDFSYKPKVNLYGDGGYLSSFAPEAYKNFGISVGVNITVPIYDGKQKKMQHDKISIAEQSRQDYRDYFKKQYAQQIAQLFQQLHATQQLIAQTNQQLSFSAALIEANQKLIETGDAHMADYILAINNYLTIKNNLTLNTITQLQLINQINYWSRK